ncbi:MAG: hypothetical protein EXS63_08030 [Candidatus Omnitrophica bacterium]|nr:hypothetical protein [Candidatus Omnitrophota bacterium]
MRKRQIDLFFRELDKALGQKAEIILLGASAGSLMGHIRPSFDIDFEIRLAPPKVRKKNIEEEILKTARKAGVAVNFSENVDHWSMISYLDYRKTAIPYKKFGRLNVKLIAPEYWTIGKMARYYALDAKDIAAIIKRKKLRPASLVRLWNRALKSSDLSLELGQFKTHACHFLKNYGRRLWGKKFHHEFYAKRLG